MYRFEYEPGIGKCYENTELYFFISCQELSEIDKLCKNLISNSRIVFTFLSCICKNFEADCKLNTTGDEFFV